MSIDHHPKVKLYSYSSCSTCRKAIKWLIENGIEYELIDITINPPDESLICKAINQIDNRKKLFNTRGVSYKQIGANVISKMSNEKAAEVLSKDGKLIKRPFLVLKGEKFLIGFDQKAWIDLLIKN